MENVNNTGENNSNQDSMVGISDYGNMPIVFNLGEFVKANKNFRTAVWTGQHLQVTLMHIEKGGEVGLEQHKHLDQLLHVVSGKGRAMMGDSKDNLDFVVDVTRGSAIIVPAGEWHNLKNTGNEPLKLYSIYSPPQHPYGTVHVTKADSDAEHED